MNDPLDELEEVLPTMSVGDSAVLGMSSTCTHEHCNDNAVAIICGDDGFFWHEACATHVAGVKNVLWKRGRQ